MASFLIVAHRGASALAPENTLSSFRRAIEMGAKAVEFDVHQSRDGELLVIHDENLKRTCGLDALVKDLDASRIRSLDAGSWFGPQFAGERVPTLRETLELLLGRAAVHLELKQGSRYYPGIEARAVRLLKEMGGLRDSVISSFDHQALFEVRRVDFSARIGYLLGRTPTIRALKDTKELKAESLHLSLRQTTAASVRSAHKHGLRVLAYTVLSAAQGRRLRFLGVDGVFANDPSLLRDCRHPHL